MTHPREPPQHSGKHPRRCQASLAALGVLLALACSGPADDEEDEPAPTRSESPAEKSGWLPDPWITVRVKMALLGAPGVDATSLNVDTVNGVVTLHGPVRSSPQRRQAERIATRIEGIRGIRNLLQVITFEKEDLTNLVDEKIRSNLQEAFTKDAHLTGSGIEIDSVLKGVVRLTGSARDWSEHLRAIRLARSVRGVRAVATDVDYDLSVDELWSSQELVEDGRSLGTAAGDLWLGMQTKLALLAQAEVPALEINVDATDGVVTLFGSVSSDEARKLAALVAASVKGVQRVENELQVIPASDAGRIQAADSELTTKVRKSIYAHRSMRHAVVKVAVEKGAVRLTGTVPTVAHEVQAALLARAVPGVRSVIEDLRVQRLTRSKDRSG